MIADDHVEDAVAEGLPELLAIRAGADGGRTLELRGSIGDLFGGEMQVVWAGFAGDGQTFFSRGAEYGDSLRAGDVNDVQTKSILAAQRDHQTNGGQFRFIRP
jgi:hypothetical protein